MTLLLAFFMAISHVSATLRQLTNHAACYKLTFAEENLWKETQTMDITDGGKTISKNNSGKSNTMNLFDPNISGVQCKSYTIDISKSTSTSKKFMDVTIVNYETNDFKDGTPRVKLSIALFYDTMVYQDKVN